MKTKSFYIAIIYCFGFLYCYAQTQTTIYTPQNSPVTAYYQIPDMSNGDKDDWSDWVVDNYPLASEQNAPSATNSYNCHGYAWHVSEGGSNRWIGYYVGQEDHEDEYWEDASYIRVSSESIAEKISYYADNHSAVQTSTQGTYISKWGPGPLMQHSRDYGPEGYNMDYRYYYAKPKITGPSLICYSAGGTYSVQIFSGVTYSWTKSSNLTFTSSTNGRSVSVSPSSSGISGCLEYVEVTITVTAYNETHVIRRYVWAGKPNPDHISFVRYMQNYLYTLTEYGDNQIVIISGYEDSQADDFLYDMDFSYTNLSPYGWIIQVHNVWDINGTGLTDISINAHNTCGWSGYSNPTTFTIEPGGWYMSMAPNPSSDYVEISITDKQGEKTQNLPEEYEITIYNSLKVPVYTSGKTKEPTKRINTAKLQNGVYFVHFRIGKEIKVKQLIIQH